MLSLKVTIKKIMIACLCCFISVVLLLAFESKSDGGDKTVPAVLLGAWPLQDNARDSIGTSHGVMENIQFLNIPAVSPDRAAFFNGRNSRIKIEHSKTLDVGTQDFSMALWVRCATPLSSTLGDLISKFDARSRRGINLHVSGSSPAYSAMSDTRHVHFGIDDAYTSSWEDHGKPWPSNSLISNLVAFEGELYCGIADADKPEDRAHVFRLTRDKKWVDCGRLGHDSNHHSVMSMIVHKGKLYAGTGIWDWVQALGGLKGAPLPAPTKVFVYEGGTKWKDLGQVGNGSRVLCMASFKGELFAGLDSVGEGKAFKFDGSKWIDCGAPDGKNFECMLPWGGVLYASTHGNIYEYQGGKDWKRIGTAPFDINQIHSMQVFDGKIHLGTWPQGYVLRHGGGEKWDKIGRLGLPEGRKLINEVMDLTVYNGKLYAGMIPNAEVFRFEKDNDWKQLGSLAKRSDWDEEKVATWARITCLSCFQGRLFAGTGSCQGRALDAPVDSSLGRVFSMQAGQVVSYEHDIGGEWTHIAAIRRGRKCELHINGKLTSSSDLGAEALFNLNNDSPMWLGFGAQNFFHGAIKDVQFYKGALGTEELAKLMSRKK